MIHLMRGCTKFVNKVDRKCFVSSFLSPLGSAFNHRNNGLKLSVLGMKKDPLLMKSGLFGIKELSHPEGFRDLQIDCLRACDVLVHEATSSVDKRNRIIARIFDDLSDELCRVADLAEFIRLAHPDPRYRISAEDACIHISSQVEKFNTHKGLFSSVYDVVDNGDILPETDIDRHVAKLFLLDFQQSGIHLNNKSREKVVSLNDEILQLGQTFSSHSQSPVIFSGNKSSLHTLQHFKKEGENYIVNSPQIDTADETARKTAFEIYYWDDTEKEYILRTLLEKRYELAQVCSFDTFAQRATLESLAEDPKTVEQFLEKLSRDLRPRSMKDYSIMLNMKPQGQSFKILQVWDVPYFSNLARSSWIKLNGSNISEYFSLGVCMEGLNMLYSRLFQVSLEVEETSSGELWHPDVYKLAVKDLAFSGKLIGHIYCDFFSRDLKASQDCHFTIQGGRLKQHGEYQNPIVVVMLNLPTPSWYTPTLLSGAMIDNLFHEMGHAMHSMLGRTEYQHVTGTRCSTDFAEMPSTLMEYFASDPRVLQAIGRHYKTGEKLPLDTLERYCAARKIFCGVDLQMQTFYSIMDQVYHGKHPLKGSTTDILQEEHEKHHNLPYNKGIAWQLRFSHLTGYGARYYSYLMARSVATSIWQKYFKDDPFNQENGMKYRQECLSHGGGKPSKQLVSDFLGESLVTPDGLADALIADIDAKNQIVYDMIKRT